MILLVEDSKLQARMIGMVLNRYNLDVEIANNGEEALAKFKSKEGKYDLVLMVWFIFLFFLRKTKDILMPIMDGMTCMKQIREYEKNNNLARTPIVLQTGFYLNRSKLKKISNGYQRNSEKCLCRCRIRCYFE